MPLAIYTSAAWTANGGIEPASQAQVEVRDESNGNLVSLFSDRAGANGLANPFNADDQGRFSFFVTGGAYKITVESGGLSQTLRYQAVGISSERDVGTGSTQVPDNDALDSRGFAQSVDSVATLRASSFPANLERLWLSGYYGVGTPGGNRSFYRNGSGFTSADDDGGKNIVDDDGVRWTDPEELGTTPEMFGADLSADDAGGISDAASLTRPVSLTANTYPVATEINFTASLLSLNGAGWTGVRVNSDETLYGSIIDSDGTPTNTLVIQSETPSDQALTAQNETRLNDFAIVHRGSGSGLLVDNIIHSNIKNVKVDCDAQGVTGIKYDNWGFFVLLEHVIVNNATNRCVHIAGTGTQHTVKDCQLSTANDTNARAALETNRPGTIIEGGQINSNLTSDDGVGILFYNDTVDPLQGGFVSGTLSEYGTAVKIDGDSAFRGVIVDAIRVSTGSGQTMVDFQNANSCLLRDSVPTAPGGGTIARFGPQSVRCGVIGNYDLCRGSMDVDPSATRPYVICTQNLNLNEKDNLTTDPNLRVIAESVDEIGRTEHNGTSWSKEFVFLSDDTADTVLPPRAEGGVKIIGGGYYQQDVLTYNANNGNIKSLFNTPNVTTPNDTQLNGTTGTDGDITVSVSSSDGLLYIENRTGGGLSVVVDFETVL